MGGVGRKGLTNLIRQISPYDSEWNEKSICSHYSVMTSSTRECPQFDELPTKWGQKIPLWLILRAELLNSSLVWGLMNFLLLVPAEQPILVPRTSLDAKKNSVLSVVCSTLCQVLSHFFPGGQDTFPVFKYIFPLLQLKTAKKDAVRKKNEETRPDMGFEFRPNDGHTPVF